MGDETHFKMGEETYVKTALEEIEREIKLIFHNDFSRQRFEFAISGMSMEDYVLKNICTCSQEAKLKFLEGLNRIIVKKVNEEMYKVLF